MTKLKTILPPTAMAVLVAIAIAASEAEAEAGAAVQLLNLGPYSLEAYSNESHHRNRLRHSKRYLKTVLRNKLSPDSSPLFTFKLSDLTELVRCENLTLEQPQMEALIDCRPLETYAVTDGLELPAEPSKRNVMYAQRSSTRMKKHAVWFGDANRASHLVRYHLSKDIIRPRIEAAQAGIAKFTEQDFGGIYMETFDGRVKCSLNSFLGINVTGLPPVAADFSGQESLLQALMRGWKYLANGFTLVLEDLHCHDMHISLPISFRGTFEVVYQQQFPYLSLNHSMATHPFPEFFEFKSQVRQVRASDDVDERLSKPDAYNTTVHISSRAGLVGAFNFELDQEFTNEDFQTGFETMKLAGTHYAALVKGNWTLDSLVKNLLVYWPTTSMYQNKPAFFLGYDNQPGEDMIGLSLRFRRDLLRKPLAVQLDEQQSQLKQHEHQEL